ncbi:hypothetical protein KI387_007205 [Taxus chinensis]|uniref:Uncharacterized protein n=1 Tax=Taxus chinensis TaxID=29808 RepID=A0AA38GP28_TAXCH|nr:hypothetical protein KI387_007205 [Taxus chinensis]
MQSACINLDYASQLQLQEALAVLLATAQQPNNSASPSSSAPDYFANTVFYGKQPAHSEEEYEMKLLLLMQELEFKKDQQELADHEQATEEMLQAGRIDEVK